MQIYIVEGQVKIKNGNFRILKIDNSKEISFNIVVFEVDFSVKSRSIVSSVEIGIGVGVPVELKFSKFTFDRAFNGLIVDFYAFCVQVDGYIPESSIIQ